MESKRKWINKPINAVLDIQLEEIVGESVPLGTVGYDVNENLQTQFWCIVLTSIRLVDPFSFDGNYVQFLHLIKLNDRFSATSAPYRYFSTLPNTPVLI